MKKNMMAIALIASYSGLYFVGEGGWVYVSRNYLEQLDRPFGK